ncbi:prolyl oligopeptidase family serine peptidase [candidate division KSB1 bacterium]|nr:prolyl oligopeptidase family serine peptidase [candidate division KSB1 bacterium]
MKKSIFSLLLVFVWIISLSDTIYSVTIDPKNWTIDDVLHQESAGNFEISPDGKWLVWTKTSPSKELDKNISQIMLSSLTDSFEIQLTHEKSGGQSPRWSPDGKYIAFTAARDSSKVAQIWLFNTRGGEPVQLTTLENGVTAFNWQNSHSIIFSARENRTLYEKQLKKKKDDTIVVGDETHFRAVRLFKLDIKSKKIERLTSNSGKISEFVISPDGNWIVTNEDQSVHYEYDHRIPPHQFLYHIATNTREEIFIGKKMKPSGFVWSLDGAGFFGEQPLSSDPADDYVNVSTLYYFDLKTKKYQQINLNWEKQLGMFGYQVTSDGILVSLANGTKNKLAFYRKQNQTWERHFLDDKNAENFVIRKIAKDGKTVILGYSTASLPEEIKLGQLEGNKIINQKTIIRLNPTLRKKYLAQTEILTWKGAKGEPVEGILYYPHQFQRGKKYPLMLSIHGGPAGADVDWFGENWADYSNLLATKGTFVLKVNYHGSGNYGLKWVESIKGHYYEYEIPDIFNGIDYLIKRGLVDPAQLGIMGWSNGAILAIQSTVVSNRFKVCLAGAGDVNWTSDYGNCKFGAAFDNAYFGGPPWKKLQNYIEKSPLFKMEKVSTPTLICFGTEDTSVPTSQGWEYYRALQQIGKAPVRFLLFPGAEHGLRRLSHQRRKMDEDIKWLDKYFFQKSEEENEAFKKSSPLALALKKLTFSKVLGRYGILFKGKLIPETVPLDSLKIGRFEITRAQFHEFQPDYLVKAGFENFPANEITFEQAQGYCAWLSEMTGQKYRLLRESEMTPILVKVRTSSIEENTLDYWAGYHLTPDEYESLKPKFTELEKSASLLMEVGSRPPVSEAQLVFDLDGNVAEWCLAKDGKGVIPGYSAVSTTDNKTPFKQPEMPYIGFRIVLEE